MRRKEEWGSGRRRDGLKMGDVKVSELTNDVVSTLEEFHPLQTEGEVSSGSSRSLVPS